MEIDRARKRLLRQEKREETRREMDPAAAVQPFQRELRYDNVRSAVAEEGLLRMLFREPALLAQTEGLTAEDFSVPLFGRSMPLCASGGRTILPSRLRRWQTA